MWTHIHSALITSACCSDSRPHNTIANTPPMGHMTTWPPRHGAELQGCEGKLALRINVDAYADVAARRSVGGVVVNTGASAPDGKHTHVPGPSLRPIRARDRRSNPALQP